MTKKYMLLALVGALLIPVGSIAQSTNWGDVAGGDQSGIESKAAEGSTNESPWGEASDVQSEASVKPEPTGNSLACGEDDSRYSQLMTVLRTVKEGGNVDPLQTSFSTYAGMNKKVRDMLGSNIFISSPDCSKQFVFDGELTGKVTLPFPELWSLIASALRVGDKEKIDFILASTTAAPEPASNLISMVQYAPLDGQQLSRLKSVMGYGENGSAEQSEIIMLDIYLQFGGGVTDSDRGKLVTIAVNSTDRLNELRGVYLENGEGYSKVRMDGSENTKKISSLLASSGLRTTFEYDSTAKSNYKNNSE